MSSCMSIVQVDLCPFGLTTYHLLFIYLYILIIAIWITGHVQVVCPLSSMSTCMSSLCPGGLTTCHLLFIYLYILLIAIWITVHVEFMSGCMSTKFYVHLVTSG